MKINVMYMQKVRKEDLLISQRIAILLTQKLLRMADFWESLRYIG